MEVSSMVQPTLEPAQPTQTSSIVTKHLGSREAINHPTAVHLWERNVHQLHMGLTFSFVSMYTHIAWTLLCVIYFFPRLPLLSSPPLFPVLANTCLHPFQKRGESWSNLHSMLPLSFISWFIFFCLAQFTILHPHQLRLDPLACLSSPPPPH